MAGPNAQKRRRDAAQMKTALPVPRKKVKKQRDYHSSSDDERADAQGFNATHITDSDDGIDDDNDDNDDIHNAIVDDGTSSVEEDDGSDVEPPDTESERQDDQLLKDSATNEESAESRKAKSKHNNNSQAFAASMNKILHSKLTTSRRADPVLSRSVDAAKAAKEAEETALEAKARRKLREQKKQAKEKGRIRNVFIGHVDEKTGEQEKTTSEIMADEKRLRKLATKGVVRMFNAIRQAQAGVLQAQSINKEEGVIGFGNRDEKVAEMSKDAFLDLIAKGGGGLSKKPLEEA